MPTFFSRHSAHRLNVTPPSESGLARPKVQTAFPRAKRRQRFSPGSIFATVTAPLFLETHKRRFSLAEWHRMSYLRHAGLWLSFDCRGAIGYVGELVPKHKKSLDHVMDTSPRKPSVSQNPDGHRQEWFPGWNGLSDRGCQAACCLQCWVERTYSFFKRSRYPRQSSLAKVK